MREGEAVKDDVIGACKHGNNMLSCGLCEIDALRAKLDRVCDAGPPPIAVMLAVEILCNHVEPGWENSKTIVRAWVDEERATRATSATARSGGGE